jgi:hypothetical protein
MKKTRNSLFTIFVCMICAILMLPGCSYFDRAAPDLDDLAWTDDGGGAAPANVVAEPLPEPVDVAEVIARATQGRVQLYNIDPIMPLDSSAMVNYASSAPEEKKAETPRSAVQIFPF